jgi:hypothetical protein
MQETVLYPILAASLLVASWLISFIANYLLALYTIRRAKKSWSEMDLREQTYVQSISGLGCFPGGLFFLLSVGTTRLLGTHAQWDNLLIVVWVLVSVVVGAIAGILPTRK